MLNTVFKLAKDFGLSNALSAGVIAPSLVVSSALNFQQQNHGQEASEILSNELKACLSNPVCANSYSEAKETRIQKEVKRQAFKTPPKAPTIVKDIVQAVDEIIPLVEETAMAINQKAQKLVSGPKLVAASGVGLSLPNRNLASQAKASTNLSSAKSSVPSSSPSVSAPSSSASVSVAVVGTQEEKKVAEEKVKEDIEEVKTVKTITIEPSQVVPTSVTEEVEESTPGSTLVYLGQVYLVEDGVKKVLINDGDSLVLSDDKEYTIVVDIPDEIENEVESVTFELNDFSKTENLVPYALNGDSGTVERVAPFAFVQTSYSLNVNAMSENSGEGETLEQRSISFNVSKLPQFNGAQN